MKKKTVITTERQEVWVIRQGWKKTEKQGTSDEPPSIDSLITLTEQCPDIEVSPKGTNEHEKAGSANAE